MNEDTATYTCPYCGFRVVMAAGFVINHYANNSHGFTVEVVK